LRRPVGEGRGYAVVIAASRDGEEFEPIATLSREDFDCDSFERPALISRPDGKWPPSSTPRSSDRTPS
jgi:hypothetical protein